jgi:hypothetical protein
MLENNTFFETPMVARANEFSTSTRPVANTKLREYPFSQEVLNFDIIYGKTRIVREHLHAFQYT